MSTGTYSLVKVAVAGDVITASDRNAEHQNHITNANPDGIGAHSDNATEMQATRDPYPGGVESLAADLGEELESLRYLIKQITGMAQWYIDPVGLHMGTFSRDMTAASGDVAYTGIGFTPKAVIFLAGVSTASISVGFGNASIHACIVVFIASTTGFGTYSSLEITLIEEAGKSQAAVIKSLDSDGFTLTWTKNGSPSAATASIFYLAIP